MMARLVTVIEKEDNYDFKRRQVPLEVDNLNMVVQFSDKCMDCDCDKGIKQKDLESFTNKFNTLTKDEIAVALLVSRKSIMSLLSHMVPCVGCRKSVERLFSQLQKSQHPALEPLVITARGELSMQHEYLFDPRSVFSLFHVHGSKLHSVVESIPKSKKNKRCNLHSLETHKSKTLGCWLEAWDALSDTCREKVLVVDMNRLLTTVDSYLEKHKFCAECKSKVLLAYSILVGEKDSSVEKGYCAALYENLRCCAQGRHVHVLNDTEFIAHLLEKAEPEFLGGKRDRHAKTLDIAQEEVLTCLGIHIFERLHTIWQRLRAEEQTWLILFYVGVDALRKNYEVALEEKQGASNLELLCEELEEKEKRQVEKKEMKKQKKKQKKAKAQVVVVGSQGGGEANSNTSVEGESSGGNEGTRGEVACKCGSVDNNNSRGGKGKNSSGNNLNFQNSRHHNNNGDANFNSLTLSLQGCDLSLTNGHHCNGNGSVPRKKNEKGIDEDKDMVQDDDDDDGCDDCNLQGSNDGSEEGDSCECDMLRSSPFKNTQHQRLLNGPSNHNKLLLLPNGPSSFQSLLESLCSEEEDDDDPGISEEDILAFKALQGDVASKRQKLRQDLKEKFEDFIGM